MSTTTIRIDDMKCDYCGDRLGDGPCSCQREHAAWGSGFGDDEARARDGRCETAADAMDKYARDPDTREIVLDARITLFEAVLLYTYWDVLILYSECDPGPSMSELRYELYMAARRGAVYRALKPLLGDAFNEYPPKGTSLDLLRKTGFHIGECFPSRLAEMPSLMRDVKRMIALRLAPPVPGETPEQGSQRMRSEDDRINAETCRDREVMRTGRDLEEKDVREPDGGPANPHRAEVENAQERDSAATNTPEIWCGVCAESHKEKATRKCSDIRECSVIRGLLAAAGTPRPASSCPAFGPCPTCGRCHGKFWTSPAPIGDFTDPWVTDAVASCRACKDRCVCIPAPESATPRPEPLDGGDEEKPARLF